MWTSSKHTAKASSVYKPSLTKGQFDILLSNWHDFSDSLHASLPKQCVQLITWAFKCRVYVSDKQWFFTPLICLMNRIVLQVCLSASCLFKVYRLLEKANFVLRIPLVSRCLCSLSSWIGHVKRPDPHSNLNTERKYNNTTQFNMAIFYKTFFFLVINRFHKKLLYLQIMQFQWKQLVSKLLG